MRRVLAVCVWLTLAGCSLAGDITPPPALATMQAAQTVPPATEATPAAREATVPPAEPGTLRGRVTNGTSGGPVPAGVEVRLSGYENSQEVFQQTTTTDAAGNYLFAGIPAVPGRIYGVSVAYLDVLYYSEGTRLLEGQAGPELLVTVYETTDDTLPLHIERLHVLFDFSVEDQVQVVELWVLSNRGDRTIVPAPGRGVVDVSLPPGATDLAFEGDSSVERFVVTGTGFADREPVLPGTATSQFIFSYWLQYDGGLAFSRPVDHPVNAAVVLIPQSGVRVSGEGLRDQGVQILSGQPVQTYEHGAIAPGGALEIELRGEPGVGPSGAPGGWTNVLVGSAVLVLLLAGTGVWWFGRRQPGARAEARKEALLDAIAALDNELAAGRLDAAEHRRRREALKQELRQRMRMSHD